MRWREFVAGLGSVAAMASRPVAVRAQQPKRMRHVGVLTGLPEDISEVMVGAFARSLESLGWVEGENIRICLSLTSRPPRRSVSLCRRACSISPMR